LHKTLLEVNLAIFIMAMGVLAMCSLYSLGFQENRQSKEDVVAVGFADAFLAPLVQGLSATNMPWSSWTQVGDKASVSEQSLTGVDGVWPKSGWLAYLEVEGGYNGSYQVRRNPKSIADQVFSQVSGKIPSPYKGSRPSLDGRYQYALVVPRHGSTIQLAFRAARRGESMMSQPVFVSEVRFQGVIDSEE
jgi:hypothetical protein